LATLHELYADGKIERSVVDKAIKELGINPEKSNPITS
jgi:pyruvate dehydrogenase complex dehydrogenase (E1) component